MFCQSCGKEMNNSMVFCPYCGAKTGIGVASQAVGTQEPARIKTIFAIIAGIFALASIAPYYLMVPVSLSRFGRIIQSGQYAPFAFGMLIIIICFISCKDIKKATTPCILIMILDLAEFIREMIAGKGQFKADYKIWLTMIGYAAVRIYLCGIILLIMYVIALHSRADKRRILAIIVTCSFFILACYYIYRIVGMIISYHSMNLDIKFTDISIMLKLRLVFMELAFMVLSLAVAQISKKKNSKMR
jgi:hypothetical protein